MLFLAVFCGFLAEYQLEHTIEHQREKKYIASMAYDLERDTQDLVADIRWWTGQARRMDSILLEIDKAPGERKSVVLYRCASYMRRYNNFEYHDRTMGQLKNAGFFRLLRKKKVADRLMEYDARVQRTLLGVEEGAQTLYLNFNLFQNKVLDSRYFPTVTSSYNLDSAYALHPETFRIRPENEKDLFEYANHLRYYKGNVMLRIEVMKQLLNYGRTTLTLMKEEYHLK